MPIYAYRCESCGHAKDVLQKISDPVLSTCPACHAETFKKQLTAAGFQLKGSGWYVTDFRGGNGANGAAKSSDKTESKSDASDSAKSDSPSSGSSTTSASASGGCGDSCACH